MGFRVDGVRRCLGKQPAFFIGGRDNRIRSQNVHQHPAGKLLLERCCPTLVRPNDFSFRMNGGSENTVSCHEHRRQGAGDADTDDTADVGRNCGFQLAAQIPGSSCADDDAHAFAADNPRFTLQPDSRKNHHNPYATRREFVCFKL